MENPQAATCIDFACTCIGLNDSNEVVVSIKGSQSFLSFCKLL